MTLRMFGKEIHINKELIIVIVLLLLGVAAVIGFYISGSGNAIIIETQIKADGKKQQESSVNSSTPEGEMQYRAKETEEELIKVYVVGCVKNPGIVTIRRGQLIDDAVTAAGGVTDEADIENINMAYELKSNVMLKILSKSQNKAVGNADIKAKSGVQIIKDSGGAIADEVGKDTGSGGKININTASASELDTLPGIGEATARDIIAFREKNGYFKTIQDIMKVPRIKQSRFNSIKDLISVN